MYRIFMIRQTAITIFAVFACWMTGCGTDAPDDSTSIECNPDAAPFFLATKLDDDDGDGNPFDEDFPNINDEDDDIADHTWIRDKSGVYHLFFQNEGLTSGSEIEHYTSTDLQTLDYAGVALRPDPNSWDSYALWAPHVIEYSGTYYMLYTGVDTPLGPDSKQRIGLATSTDLATWVRVPVNNCPGTTGDGCVYQCDETWTTWGDPPGSFNQQCRDPFVIWDQTNQRWVLFVTAKSTNQFGVITVAYAPNLTDWSGAGFVDATRRLTNGTAGQPTGGQCENPFIMTNAGDHYLLFVDWQDPEDSLDVHDPRTQGQYATSTTLEVDSLGSANWIYRGYIPDPGVNAMEVQRIDEHYVMSQSISNERSGYLETHRRNLRLKCVTFGGNFSFQTSELEFIAPVRPPWLGRSTAPANEP